MINMFRQPHNQTNSQNHNQTHNQPQDNQLDPTEPLPVAIQFCLQAVIQAATADDATLADAIVEHAKLSRLNSAAVDLRLYLETVPSLADRPEPFDAAIESVIQTRLSRGHSMQQVTEELLCEYPAYTESIRIACLLTDLFTTDQLRRTFDRSVQLPCRFGPLGDDGQQRFELIEHLGSGISGDVYRAIDHNLSDNSHTKGNTPAPLSNPDHDEHLHRGTQVAIKILALDEYTPAQRAVLADEGRITRAVQCPHVVTVFDRGKAPDGQEFVVMELATQRSMDRWLSAHSADARPDARLLITLISDVARGVHAAHQVGIIHGDLKPANILLFNSPHTHTKTTAHSHKSARFPTRDKGQQHHAQQPSLPDAIHASATHIKAKLADFGVATRYGSERATALQRASQGLAPIGNLATMAPEVREGALPSMASDIYSLGGMLHFALTGSLHSADFSGASSHALDRRLRAIINRAIQAAPADRYSSAADFANDLDHWLNGRTIPWLDRSPMTRTRLWIRRSPWQAAGMLAMLIAVGSLAFIVLAARERAIFNNFQQTMKTSLGKFVSGHEGKLTSVNTPYNALPALISLELLLKDGLVSADYDSFLTPEVYQLALHDEIVVRDPNAHETMLLRLGRVIQILISQTIMDSVVTETDALLAYFAPRLDPSDPLLEKIKVLGAVARIKDTYAHTAAEEKVAQRPDPHLANRHHWAAVEEQYRLCLNYYDSITKNASVLEQRVLNRDPVLRLALKSAMHVAAPKRLDDKGVYQRLYKDVQTFREPVESFTPQPDPES